MNRIQKKRNDYLRRSARVRARIARSEAPRLSVFRSLKYFSAKVIDDEKGRTLIAVTEKELPKKSGSKTDRAKALGSLLATKAIAKKIDSVVFDRGPYSYHGRVAAFAKGAREGGLHF